MILETINYGWEGACGWKPRSLEASGLSCLRLSAPTIVPFGKLRQSPFSILAGCNNNIFKSTVLPVRDKQSHYDRETVSMFKCLVLRIHLLGANRFIDCDRLLQTICLLHSCPHAFWLCSLHTHARRYFSTGHYVL